MGNDDFYEEDEPIEEIIEAFEQGEKNLTALPPRQGFNEHMVVSGTPAVGETEAVGWQVLNVC